jgi:hypothetical protein
LGVGKMMNAIVQNIKNFYDITVFSVILIIGAFLLLWDYPTLKAMKHKNDARVTLVMGIMYIILPFVLYTISRM